MTCIKIYIYPLYCLSSLFSPYLDKGNSGFSLLGEWGESPPPAQNLLIPPPKKQPPTPLPRQIYIPQPKVNPPIKQQLSSYNPIKTAFLAVVIAPAPFLF